MKRGWMVGGILVVIAAATVAVAIRTDDTAGTAPFIAGAPPSAALLARGKYLTEAADCVACHTAPNSKKQFAGGVAFKLPMGIIYSSNITADPTTGIGSWTDDEFVRAVREGVRNDGQHLYPAFPYTSYTKLARSDVLAIKAYLWSQPAISQGNRRNMLAFPFDQRWAMAFWNAAFFKSKRFAVDPTETATWNSGAYLATALGHCGECHTPRNLAFGVEHGKEFAGYELQGWRAYNITSDPRHGIGSWTADETAQYLKTGQVKGHASASGPMGEAVSHSLQYLESADIAAMVDYLRGVPAKKGSEPIDVNSRPVSAVDLGEHEQGIKLFEGACASCHEWNGQGQQSTYASLTGLRSVNDVDGANVTQAILQGVNMQIGDADVFMPSFGQAYSDTEVAALTNFVIGHFGGKQGAVTPDDVAKRRLL